MPTTTLTPSATNTADFRKSFYDDDADAMTLTRCEVVEVDGVPVAAGPDRTPSWLDYAVSTETTAEGPFGSRSWIHLDFAVPLGDPDLEHGRTYLIDMEVTDSVHTTSKTFRFYSADFDLDAVSPMALWISARKGDGANSAETNRAPGSTVVVQDDGFNPAHSPGYWGEVAAFTQGSSTAYYRRTHGPVLPSGDPAAAVSVYVVVKEYGTSSSKYDVLRQTGSARDWSVALQSNKLVVHKENDYTLMSAEPVKADDETVLLEYHREPTGEYEYRVNGAVVFSGTESDGYADANFNYVNHPHSAWSDIAVYTGQLTEDQKLWVRRKYKSLYYDYLTMDTESVDGPQS